MRKVILVNGDIATGKTHLADILKNHFNLPLYTKDEFKESFADTYPYQTIEENHKLSIMAMDSVINSFIKEAEKGNDVILEANFREEHLKELSELAKKYNYKVLNLNLIGSIDVLYQRYVNRGENEGRHPVHLVNNLFQYEKFKQYILTRRQEKLYGDEIITINSDDLSYQQDEKLLKRIEEFLLK